MSMQARVLVVDDEPDMLENCRLMLTREGFEIFTLQDSRELSSMLKQADPDVVLTDLMIPHKDGMEVMREVRWSHSDVPVVVMTAYATIETAVEAIKQGAADYLVKPFSKDQLSVVVQRVLKARELTLENRRLRKEIEQQRMQGSMIAVSRSMQEIASLISRVADTDASVLIQGESGTGKEVIARSLHHASRRNSGPFVAINCSALPSNLLESELFGHEKGAFTGAATARKGLLEEAHGGTFFFDEITEMEPAMQAKLLRVLQERKVRRVGGNREIEFDARIVSATNRDPQQAVREKVLREDLFFRLAVVTVQVPPLRERRDDISALSTHFLKEITQAYGRAIDGLAPQVLERFNQYEWPGNVRELRNVIERAVSLATGSVIKLQDLPPALQQARSAPSLQIDATESYESAKTKVLDQFQREYFTQLLNEENQNVSRVAQRAGVDRKTIYRIMKSYGWERKGDEESLPE